MVVMYLFTRYRFNWNEVDYSIFSTYSMMTNLVGKFHVHMYNSNSQPQSDQTSLFDWV